MIANDKMGKEEMVCVCVYEDNERSFGSTLSMFKCKYIIKLNGRTRNGMKRNANEIK